ncbi:MULTISPECIES: metalloregulator ArsR/SmtB family transcription factor [unclassified Isoptericola]|uniref:helix-turn-helix transcriptional regulator n=1 Tax=unclassified Isoptericola TaxID=2623355 RepID=UPI0027126DCA|nr:MULTISPECIES: helix-turn-helix domain-containing protein [unclassified Isoptericola]MDO8144740.1 helix-turn-helix domain-containing protein [Isoptericola sp. 178]MDO8149518.1 helix-turn-helix domain-containing protein [Isoptericola sp. b515]
MSTLTTTPTPVGTVPHAGADTDGTRRRVLALVASDGPVTAGDLARTLRLTSAAVRRHLACLEQDGTIAVHDAGPAGGQARRGRPARRYVVSTAGQAELGGEDVELATQVMRYLRRTAGDQAVAEFAAERNDAVVRRYAPRLTGTDPHERAAQLADLLAADGYAASVRPVAGPRVPTVQLCQGHCPVQHAAEDFPELCEAEADAFARLLGTHVQRLATLAGGAHACVTNVPLAPTTPAGRSRGTQEGTR